MANINDWMQGMSKLGNKSQVIEIKPTTEIYSEIKNMGLKTVEWKQYSADELLAAIASEVKEFVEKYNPCLFIFDPQVDAVKKGYLFGVKDVKEITAWIDANKENLYNYSYLITTLISNHGSGFVGSVHSNGKGKLICETLHSPGVCNQRELSQPTKDQTPFINELFIDETDGEIWAVSNVWLSKKDILDIKNAYMHHVGYFEFVKGSQYGKIGLYTTGHEEGGLFNFHEELHEAGCNNISFRVQGAAIRES
jgi:hypothetical protein